MIENHIVQARSSAEIETLAYVEWPGVRCEDVVTSSPLRIIDQID